MDSSVDGEEGGDLVAQMARRWTDAGRLIEQLDPGLFASLVASTEVMAVELSTVKRKSNG